jgi:2-dehydropantoate 2-reductase
MIIGMMGAGAVGCYYGAMLAQAGHDVTVIARQHHIEAIGVTARFVQNHMLSQKHNKIKGFQKHSFVEGVDQDGGIRLFCFQNPLSECISKVTRIRKAP